MAAVATTQCEFPSTDYSRSPTWLRRSQGQGAGAHTGIRCGGGRRHYLSDLSGRLKADPGVYSPLALIHPPKWGISHPLSIHQLPMPAARTPLLWA